MDAFPGPGPSPGFARVAFPTTRKEDAMSYAVQRLTLGPLGLSTLALGLYGVTLFFQVAGQYAF